MWFLLQQDTMKFKDDLKEEIKRSLEQHKKLTKEYDALRAHRVDIDRTKILLETELHAVTKQLVSFTPHLDWEFLLACFCFKIMTW